jgi:hypothetical protein
MVISGPLNTLGSFMSFHYTHFPQVLQLYTGATARYGAAGELLCSKICHPAVQLPHQSVVCSAPCGTCHKSTYLTNCAVKPYQPNV